MEYKFERESIGEKNEINYQSPKFFNLNYEKCLEYIYWNAFESTNGFLDYLLIHFIFWLYFRGEIQK